MLILDIALPDLSATADLAAKLVKMPSLLNGKTIYLEGDLGAGKTTLVRYFLEAVGYQGNVKSPTYGLMESYALERLQVLHLDLYRLSEPEELEYLGLRDLHDEETLMLVEWPNYGQGFLQAADLKVVLSGDDQQRQARLIFKNQESQWIRVVRKQIR